MSELSPSQGEARDVELAATRPRRGLRHQGRPGGGGAAEQISSARQKRQHCHAALSSGRAVRQCFFACLRSLCPGEGEGRHGLRAGGAQTGGALGQGGAAGDHVVHQDDPLAGQICARPAGVRPLDIGRREAEGLSRDWALVFRILTRVGTTRRPVTAPTWRASSSAWS